MARLALLALALTACRETTPIQPLYPVGTAQDDGHGQLAHASASLLTDDDTSARMGPTHRVVKPYIDDDEDGRSYGGPGYGGASYASYRPPPWTYPTASRTTGFTVRAGLSGVVEGTITWRGATPTLTTACGPVEPVRANKDRTLPGAVVYIERVSVGRPLVHGSGEQRPFTVGGTVLKRGCDLFPRVQVVAPVPAAITIHGDATAAQLAISSRGSTSQHELQEGGRVVLPATRDVTKIEASDGSLGAAWVVGLDSAYYAISDDRGRYRIEELAAGTYVLTFLSPPTATLVDGKLRYQGPATVERTVRVESHRATRLDVALER